jgi:hypothetical protein
MPSTLDKPRLVPQTINSNHPGVEFGVIQLDDTDTQFSLNECLTVLAEEGWSSPQEVPSAEIGVHKFLVSRRK